MPSTAEIPEPGLASHIFAFDLPSSHSSTHTVYMRNITLAVEEDVLLAARRHAADRGTTVNALVRDYLKGIASHNDRAARARARMRQLSEQSKGRLGKITWTRDELHER